MCGIAGIRRFGDEPITMGEIRILATALQHRGLQATGVCFAKGEDIQVYKSDDPAWTFVKSVAFENFVKEQLEKEPEVVLIHDRAATKGDPRKNENNHPVYAGITAVTHNGVIGNDDELFRDMKLERKAEVDTDIVRAILDAHGLERKGIDQLRRMRGSAALACVSPRYPSKLLLARSGSPLILASTPEKLYWASEKKAIHSAMRPFFQRHNMIWQANRVHGEVGFITMNNNSAYIIGENGLEWHQEFSPCASYASREYRAFENWRSTRERFNYPDARGVVRCVLCPNPTCQEIQALDDSMKEVPLKDLRCTACGEALDAAKAIEAVNDDKPSCQHCD